MGRRPKLILGTLVAAIAVAAVAFFAEAPSVNLVCTLKSDSEGPLTYGFRINIPIFGEPRVLWTQQNKRLRLARFDDTLVDATIGVSRGALPREEFIAEHGYDPKLAILWGRLTFGLLPYPYVGVGTLKEMRHGADTMLFRFFRSTGEAQIFFYRSQTPIHFASEYGRCSKAKPVF